MKTTVFSLCLLLFFLACQQESKTAQTTEESAQVRSEGKITITVGEKLKGRFFYNDDFGNSLYLNIGPNTINPEHPNLQLIDSKFNTSYLLNDGETIEIASAGDSVSLKSADSTRNLELLFTSVLFQKNDYKYVSLWTAQRAMLQPKFINNPALRDSLFQEEEQTELAILRDYQQKHKLSEAFYKLNQSFIKYRMLERRLILNSRNGDFPKPYVDTIIAQAQQALNNDDFLFLSAYRHSLINLLELLHKKHNTLGYHEVINSHFKNQAKAFFQATYILDAHISEPFFTLSKTDLANLTKDFTQNCKVPAYCGYVQKTLNVDTISIKNDELLDVGNKKVKFSSLANAQLSYIDFWASWCAPCRAEMPDSKKLKAEYSKRGISFIYISIDENAAAWQKAMQQIGLPTTESYLLPKSKSSAITKAYKINTIPRYMLMDKNGNIINADAPRPSDLKTRQMFDKHLKQ